jgi:hypothetical protein
MGTAVSVLPPAQTHGLSRGWLPTIGPTFWSTLPFSSGPPQGGLLSSLNAGAANRPLGRLAASVEHLESAHPGGIWALLSSSAAEPMGAVSRRCRGLRVGSR